MVNWSKNSEGGSRAGSSGPKGLGLLDESNWSILH